jgi:copper chaperone NosL
MKEYSQSSCIAILFLILVLNQGCEVKPQDITYGQDQCSACKMMIMDNRFGSELVTAKGKVYKYDAIECMVRDIIKNPDMDYSYHLVSDFLHPGVFIDAQRATYLVDPQRPSPMGANLSAYPSKESLLSSELTDGQQYDWNGLITLFSN